jgi:hypothetical protein
MFLFRSTEVELIQELHTLGDDDLLGTSPESDPCLFEDADVRTDARGDLLL